MALLVGVAGNVQRLAQSTSVGGVRVASEANPGGHSREDLDGVEAAASLGTVTGTCVVAVGRGDQSLLQGSSTEALATELDTSVGVASIGAASLTLGGCVPSDVERAAKNAGAGAVGEAAQVLELLGWLGTTRAEASLAASPTVEVSLAAVTELGATVAVSSAKASSRAVKGTADTVHRGGHSANLEHLRGFLVMSVSVDDAIRGSADIMHTKDWAGMAKVAVAAETRKKALESILMLVWLFEAGGVQGKRRCFQDSRDLRAGEDKRTSFHRECMISYRKEYDQSLGLDSVSSFELILYRRLEPKFSNSLQEAVDSFTN